MIIHWAILAGWDRVSPVKTQATSTTGSSGGISTTIVLAII